MGVYSLEQILRHSLLLSISSKCGIFVEQLSDCQLVNKKFVMLASIYRSGPSDTSWTKPFVVCNCSGSGADDILEMILEDVLCWCMKRRLWHFCLSFILFIHLLPIAIPLLLSCQWQIIILRYSSTISGIAVEHWAFVIMKKIISHLYVGCYYPAICLLVFQVAVWGSFIKNLHYFLILSSELMITSLG